MDKGQPSRRILLLSTSVGSGHVRAAQAIELALRALDPNVHVDHRDTLTLARGLSSFYRKSYTLLAARAPHLLGSLYVRYDRRTARIDGAERLKLALECACLRPLRTLINAQPWDAVVSTHILSGGVVAAWRKRGEVRARSFTVTTDFQTHRFWVNDPTDHYFTGTDAGAYRLRAHGVPADDITVTGIPIDPVFRTTPDRQVLRKRHGLRADRPVILQLGGGIGFGPLARLYRGLLSLERPVEIVVVAGSNDRLRRELAEIPVPARHGAHLLGFTDKMHELMGAADLFVGKPGGLSVAEALACGLALIITEPIPGQEAGNCDYLLESGVAIKIDDAAVLPGKLAALLDDPERLSRLQRNARRLARPDAASDVANKILALTE